MEERGLVAITTSSAPVSKAPCECFPSTATRRLWLGTRLRLRAVVPLVRRSGFLRWVLRVVSVFFVCVAATYGAQTYKVPEQKKRVGNWYYISGTDGMFRVPRFIAAVHDTTASTSLIFTCQLRPGVPPSKDTLPIMTTMLGLGVGRPGQKKIIKMRFDKTPVFKTTWVTEAVDLTSLQDSAQTDPLRLLLRIVGNKHRLLQMDLRTRRLDFDLDGATAVILEMFDACIKPAMGIKPVMDIEPQAPKRRRK
jgi:hypothetical protein